MDLGAPHAEFRQTYAYARGVRADIAFGEQILDIADNTAGDWSFDPASGKLAINKEAILRSKLRIQARRFHMERLHRDTWGEKISADIATNYSLISEEERIRRALELIGIAREITGPKPEPPALRYDPGTEEAEPEPTGIG